jgi:hypothetical protein
MASTLDLGLCIEDVRIAGHAQPIMLRSYRPASDGTILPIVVYFHGGGFTRGSLDDADMTATSIARDTAAWRAMTRAATSPRVSRPLHAIVAKSSFPRRSCWPRCWTRA